MNLSMGAIAGAVMWGASSRGLLLGWLALVVATNVFRLAAWHLRQRDPDRDRRWQFWARVCVAAMFGSGITWGMGAALMISPESPILMAFWLILVTGIGAGLVAANAFHLPALWAYLFPLLLPVVARIAAQGGFEYLAIAAGLTFYLVFCVQQGRHQARLVLESFRMRSENQSLVVQLQNETRAALVAKQSAEESERAKSRFFAAASHDLRQPLQAVSLYASSLSHAALPESEMSLVRGIGESAAALTDLFDELLEIARLDARTIVCDPKQITLQQVFNRLELLFAPVAIDSATRLYIRPCGYSLRVDELLLTRLLGNLVGNGLKYAKGGTVVLLARKRADELLIEVRDNGPGISPEQQALVFEEFYQAANPERDRQLGFGLGLPTAVRIGDLLGARIGVRSRPGAGSVFWVRLPVGAAPTA